MFSKHFKNYFPLTSEQRKYRTRGTRLNIATIKTTKCDSNSVTLKAVKQWNTIQNSLRLDISCSELIRPKVLIKNLIINYINSL